MDKKNFRLWLLYDFANSIAFIALGFYFSLYFVSDNGMPDYWLSIAVVFSTVLLLLLLPALGRLSDRMQRRMPFLIQFTVLAILSLVGLGAVAMSEGAWSSEKAFTIITFYFLFYFFYQGSLVFYDSMIPNFIGKRSSESVSGWGMGFGQVGNLVGLVVALQIAEGKWSLFGHEGRSATFLVGALIFFVLVLPVLLFLKDKKTSAPPTEFRPAKEGLKIAMKDKNIRYFLISYYLFADAILTLQLFVSLYLEEVAQMDDKQKTVALLIALLCGVVGAWVSPKLAKIFKSTRKTIHLLIGAWALLLMGFALSKTPGMFTTLLILNGFAFGALFALARAYYSQIIPQDKQAELFSIFVLFERAASILGPLVWSGTILAFSSFGSDRYRFAMFSLGMLVAISFLVFRKVKPQEHVA